MYSDSIIMMKILLVVFYLSGWNIPTCCFPRQYHYVPDKKNWTEAQTYCRQTYTDLATIDNSEELKQFLNISTAGYSSDVWIGLYSKVNWRWSDGYNGNGAEYRKWAKAQPDFYGASQYCVNAANSGLWWDDDCRVAYPFICSRAEPRICHHQRKNELVQGSEVLQGQLHRPGHCEE
uniref:C-type lectin domain-containing protein n=1 Tax=Mastacembelus armatus TaxID=205130 RepID=A0A3Q3KUW2_9TELE